MPRGTSKYFHERLVIGRMTLLFHLAFRLTTTNKERFLDKFTD